MANLNAYSDIGSAVGTPFSNNKVDDFIFYTDSSNQSILLGCAQSNNSAMAISFSNSSNIIGINGNLNVNGTYSNSGHRFLVGTSNVFTISNTGPIVSGSNTDAYASLTIENRVNASNGYGTSIDFRGSLNDGTIFTNGRIANERINTGSDYRTSTVIYTNGNSMNLQKIISFDDLNGTVLYGVGGASSTLRLYNQGNGGTNDAFSINRVGWSNEQWFRIRYPLFISTVSTGSTTNSCLYVAKDDGTGRSINCAGSLTGMGADYAEYFIKKDVSIVIAKGDLVGINANGNLTNVYDESISFVVKSTDPCLVGGDTWYKNAGVPPTKPINEEASDQYKLDLQAYELRLEEERQKVDRIAFSGRVPVNVYNTIPGDYIVPVRTESGGISASNVRSHDITFDQYKKRIGKVTNILDDGRAYIIVSFG